jgi:hypothetical protein
MTERDLLRDALAAPDKGKLERHRPAILELRRKSYSWREIAEFLNERGVTTDHTKVFRFITKAKHTGGIMKIPTAAEYKAALSTLKITPIQRKMLEGHYGAHNRTMTYREIAKAAGEEYDSNQVANSQYGGLGFALGSELNFPFTDLDNSGKKFYSSAIGMGMPDAYSSSNEFQLVMHHELAKALDQLNWFPA